VLAKWHYLYTAIATRIAVAMKDNRFATVVGQLDHSLISSTGFFVWHIREGGFYFGLNVVALVSPIYNLVYGRFDAKDISCWVHMLQVTTASWNQLKPLYKYVRILSKALRETPLVLIKGRYFLFSLLATDIVI
jgi:hypothetical protein